MKNSGKLLAFFAGFWMVVSTGFGFCQATGHSQLGIDAGSADPFANYLLNMNSSMQCVGCTGFNPITYLNNDGYPSQAPPSRIYCNQCLNLPTVYTGSWVMAFSGQGGLGFFGPSLSNFTNANATSGTWGATPGGEPGLIGTNARVVFKITNGTNLGPDFPAGVTYGTTPGCTTTGCQMSFAYLAKCDAGGSTSGTCTLPDEANILAAGAGGIVLNADLVSTIQSLNPSTLRYLGWSTPNDNNWTKFAYRSPLTAFDPLGNRYQPSAYAGLSGSPSAADIFSLGTYPDMPAVVTMQASISGLVLTVTSITGTLHVGQTIEAAGVISGSYVLPYGTNGTTGTGGLGTYSLSVSSSVGSEAMTGSWVDGEMFHFFANANGISGGTQISVGGRSAKRFAPGLVGGGGSITAGLTITNGGTGYNGGGSAVFNNVPLQQVSSNGINAWANITVTSGVVTSVTLSASSTQPNPVSMTASMASGVLNVTSVTQGTIGVGQTVQGANVPIGTYIKSLGTGSGGTGTYNITSTSTVGSELMMAMALSSSSNPGGEFFAVGDTVTATAANLGNNGGSGLVLTVASVSCSICNNNIYTFSYNALTNRLYPSGAGIQAGLPLERAVALANATNTNIWWQAPQFVDDASVLQIATYVANNLNPKLQFILEFANETWNGAYYAHNADQAGSVALGIGGPCFSSGCQASAGSGYVPNTYTNVPLFNLFNDTQPIYTMPGSGMLATVVVNGSGNVSDVTITSIGNGNYFYPDQLTANNASLGGTGSGFIVQIGGEPNSHYCWRQNQIAREIQNLWTTLNPPSTYLVPLNGSTVEAGGGPSTVPQRFRCSLTTLSQNASYVGEDMSVTGNRLIDRGDFYSYALYFEGSTFNEQFAQWTPHQISGLYAADAYQAYLASGSTDVASLGRAMEFIDWDTYSGTSQGVNLASAWTISYLGATGFLQEWENAAASSVNFTTKYPAGLKFRCYEGALADWYPLITVAAPNNGCTTCAGIDPALWVSGTAYSFGQTVTASDANIYSSAIAGSGTNTGNNPTTTTPTDWTLVGPSYATKMQNLVIAYRNSAFSTATMSKVWAQWKSFPHSDEPAYSGLASGNPFTLILTDLYDTKSGMFSAMQSFNANNFPRPFNYLLRRDLDGGNDNMPMWINRVA
jgi:hypothetical protein